MGEERDGHELRFDVILLSLLWCRLHIDSGRVGDVDSRNGRADARRMLMSRIERMNLLMINIGGVSEWILGCTGVWVSVISCRILKVLYRCILE